MTDLKLLALDNDDLAVISAHMQDAVFKVGDIAYLPRTRQFTLVANRFVWEQAERKRRSFERRRTILTFKRVEAVRSTGIDRTRTDDVRSLLAVRFRQEGEGPGGVLELVLAGGGTIALEVECIEGQLADTGAAWETTRIPGHPV
ncbi:DUF2948 family protein [Ciceribacter azotifigens]|uniref:DUF2948 family protein n=1 Tax=Ciceribacter azotifigens TaxID=2069303 RepID=UPI003A856B82